MTSLLLLAVLACLRTPIAADAARRVRLSSESCVPYRTTNVPPRTRCMVMPWQVEEMGPEARSVYIVLAPGCFRGRPTIHAVEGRGEIKIVAFGWRPAVHNGRLDLSCGSSATVDLRSPLDGREITHPSWPHRLRFGSLTHATVVHPLGLPRLLGLSPNQAERTLWLWGFRSRLTHRGPEVVSQVPGWGLIGAHSTRPSPYSGVTQLAAGPRFAFPHRPPTTAGNSTGLLVGAIRFVGGPPYTHPRPPTAGVIVLFGARGRLLARFHVPGASQFRLKVNPGTYLLVDDSEGWISCGPGKVRVRRHHASRVTVPIGCDVI